jgi:hypothetical protein
MLILRLALRQTPEEQYQRACPFFLKEALLAFEDWDEPYPHSQNGGANPHASTHTNKDHAPAHCGRCYMTLSHTCEIATDR